MTSDKQAERRRHRRLELACPIRFTCGAAGPRPQGQGLTVDISSGGVRFETEVAEPPPVHSEIAVCVTIPHRPDEPESPVFLSGSATVLRCRHVDAASRRHTGARWTIAARFGTSPDISLPILESFTLGNT